MGMSMSNDKQIEQIKQFLYSEICERRDYSASRMCEEVIKFIEQMSNNKQSSIEWLAQQLYEQMEMCGDGGVYDKIIKQAKTMHKEEIKKAIKAGRPCEDKSGTIINSMPNTQSMRYCFLAL
jgi:hypothetical protein